MNLINRQFFAAKILLYNKGIFVRENEFKMLKSLLKIGLKSAQCVVKKGKNAVKSAEILPKKDLYCVEYWKDAVTEGLLKPSNQTSVKMHGYLNSINHNFIIPGQPKLMDSVHWQTNMTPREMISMTDFEFKRLKPLEQKMHVYRAIGEKPEFFSEYKLYQKAKDIKKGDVMMMREYAYATSDPSYAQVYLTNNKGILYEIDVPEGAKISRIGDIGSKDEIVFPRASRFECTDVKEIRDFENDYTLVNLKYLC